MKFFFLLSFVLTIYLSSRKNIPEWQEVKIRAVGSAEIYTTGVISGVEMMIFCDENGRSSAIIKWDNQTLFGTAQVCSQQVMHSKDGAMHIYYQGEFDCSNVGGWPEGTWSNFDMQIYDFNYQKDFEGFYRIQGNGILPKQIGKFKMKVLGKILTAIDDEPTCEPLIKQSL